MHTLMTLCNKVRAGSTQSVAALRAASFNSCMIGTRH